jgi:formate C-acetyltransferase
MYNGIDPITKELIGVSCGDSFSSFDEFYEAVKKQLVFFANRTREQISHYETYYMEVNPSPVLSATMDECITQEKTLCRRCKYNNSSINAFGIATAIDSLIAIKNSSI